MGRIFTQGDQESFAVLSGDINPAHLDPLYARRLPHGRLIVHGVHLVLWALDSAGVDSLGSLKVQFKNAVLVGDEVHCEVSSRREQHLELRLYSRGELTTVLQVGRGAATHLSVADSIPEPTEVEHLKLEDLPQMQGAETLQISREGLAKMFPHLARQPWPAPIAVLLAVTRVVGVRCPGLNSLLFDIALSFDGSCTETGSFLWRVKDADERFSRVELDVCGRGWTGSVSAFLRPPVHPQPDMEAIQCRVSEASFYDQRALVIGGSRGIGECAAKILAAGGADVTITFKSGQADAEKVVSDIISHRGRARSVYWDVLGDCSLPGEDWIPTHIYYFATPPIFVGSRQAFSSRLFSQFCEFYVVGFVKTMDHFVAKTKNTLKVLYPSSVALEKIPRDMAEYVASKAAGETTCRYLMGRNPQLAIQVERLPRIATDQTASLMPAKTAEAVDILLPILYSLA